MVLSETAQDRSKDNLLLWLADDKERNRAVKAMRSHDNCKRSGAKRPRNVQEIEDRWDFATPLEAFCWKLSKFYKLTWLKRFSPALKSCLGRLQAEI